MSVTCSRSDAHGIGQRNALRTAGACRYPLPWPLYIRNRASSHALVHLDANYWDLFPGRDRPPHEVTHRRSVRPGTSIRPKPAIGSRGAATFLMPWTLSVGTTTTAPSAVIF